MNITARIGTTLALAIGALALASTAAAMDPLAGYRDANERGAVHPSMQTSISGYVDANERARIVHRAVTPSTTRYLDAGERASRGPLSLPQVVGYVDAFERGEPAPAASPLQANPTAGDGFGWSPAAIGASSALLLALLLGASLIAARHSRGRPLAR